MFLAVQNKRPHEKFPESNTGSGFGKIMTVDRVIPCQINKEFGVTSRILTKLGVFVVPVVLITHANF